MSPYNRAMARRCSRSSNPRPSLSHRAPLRYFCSGLGETGGSHEYRHRLHRAARTSCCSGSASTCRCSAGKTGAASAMKQAQSTRCIARCAHMPTPPNTRRSLRYCSCGTRRSRRRSGLSPPSCWRPWRASRSQARCCSAHRSTGPIRRGCSVRSSPISAGWRSRQGCSSPEAKPQARSSDLGAEFVAHHPRLARRHDARRGHPGIADPLRTQQPGVDDPPFVMAA